MKGVIIKKFIGKPYSFIRGEDQKEYFLHKKECITPKDYDIYCWKGNTVEFIASSASAGIRPIAKNVKFTSALNPRKDQIEADNKKHEEKICKKLHAQSISERNARNKEYDEDHAYYVLQVSVPSLEESSGIEWIYLYRYDAYLKENYVAKYKNLNEAESYIIVLRKMYPENSFRIVKKRIWFIDGKEIIKSCSKKHEVQE